MSGITELEQLLSQLAPVLDEGEYVFVTRPRGEYGSFADLAPVASISEKEGLSLIIPLSKAEEVAELYETTYRMITLQVHSSLNAVGLTACISDTLAANGISANVVAGYFHDHIFVPSERATQAMATLMELSKRETN